VCSNDIIHCSTKVRETSCRIADKAKPWLCRGTIGDVQGLLEMAVTNGVFQQSQEALG
jgi:hypothetical protein